MSYNSSNGCFTNLIAVRGCATPTSGIYINDLDIDLKELDQIAGSDYKTGQALFDAKFALALDHVTSKVYSHFLPRYRAGSILKNIRLGNTQDNMVLKAAANKLKGIHVEICNKDSYLDLYLSELSLQVDNTGDVAVYVYDLLQGVLIDTIYVSTVAGQIVTVYPNKAYKSSRRKLHLFFGYNSTFQSYYTSLGSGCSGCSSGVSNGFINANAGTIQAPYIKSSIAGASETGGLSINVSVNCNHQDWLCSVQNMIALPVAYKTAAEIMEYSISKSRQDNINSTNNLYLETNKDRLVRYGLQYKETFDDIIQNMPLPDDFRCFSCNDKFQHSTSLP